ncbi:MAG TPA: hypothetical protein PKM88_16570, partial [bacterium]|nr:hypothetical protein [bacterium]
MRPVTFVGLTDYHKPYTRVRCYHFARALAAELPTRVFSFQEHLTAIHDGVQMLELPVRERLRLNMAAFQANLRHRQGLFYLQKVHYHAAFVRWYRQCFATPYILDYDDYDFDRSPLFTPGLNRLLLGAAEPADVTMLLARQARCVVVSSHGLARHFSAVAETHLIPTGVDTAVFVPAAADVRDTVTFVWCGMIWGKVI